MTEQYLTALIGALFLLLLAIVGWVVNKAYDKLVEISVSMSALSSSLHDRITGLDRRVTVVETKCNMRLGDEHGQ